MNKKQSGLAHCCHHDQHWEFCYDFKKRVKYIKEDKPAEERGLRLRLFQLVSSALLPGKDSIEWDACLKEWDAYWNAWDAYSKTRDAYWKPWDASLEMWNAYWKAWDAYLAKYQSELGALHDKLFPDCPWNGTTIFTRRNENGDWC